MGIADRLGQYPAGSGKPQPQTKVQKSFWEAVMRAGAAGAFAWATGVLAGPTAFSAEAAAGPVVADAAGTAGGAAAAVAAGTAAAAHIWTVIHMAAAISRIGNPRHPAVRRSLMRAAPDPLF